MGSIAPLLDRTGHHSRHARHNHAGSPSHLTQSSRCDRPEFSSSAIELLRSSMAERLGIARLRLLKFDRVEYIELNICS
jgi:hypothetical protein